MSFLHPVCSTCGNVLYDLIELYKNPALWSRYSCEICSVLYNPEDKDAYRHFGSHFSTGADSKENKVFVMLCATCCFNKQLEIKNEAVDIWPKSGTSLTPFKANRSPPQKMKLKTESTTIELGEYLSLSSPLKVKSESSLNIELCSMDQLLSMCKTSQTTTPSMPNNPICNESNFYCGSSIFPDSVDVAKSSLNSKPYIETTRLQNKFGKYQCSLCEYSNNHRTVLMNHERLSHKINNESELPFDCLFCTRRFETPKQLQCHQRSHTLNDCKCRVCDLLVFSTYQERIEHEQKNHLDASNNRWTCQHCPKTFGKLNELRAHGTTHIETRSFICDDCGYSAKRKADLLRHLVSHKDVRTFACKMCPDNKKFITVASLKSHIKHFHLKKYKYACAICDKVFTYCTDRRRHQRTHGGVEKKVACSECDKRFYETKDLRKHMKSHTKSCD